MPENASEAAERGDGGREIATPRRQLARLRENLPERGLEARERLQEAMLVLSGELGYRKVTIRELLARAGVSRAFFYRQFSNKEDCYTRAYAKAIDELCETLLGIATAEPSWRDGLRAALCELAHFATARPALARGMLDEVYVAGEAAMTKRKEVFERLSRAVDSARRETDASRHSPPPIAAAFMVGAIEESVVMSLVQGAPRRLEEAMPEMVYLVSATFFGEDVAQAEKAP